MIGTFMDRIDSLRATRVRHRSRYRAALAAIPPTLYPYWKQTAQFEFKGIPRNAFFFARAAEGLLTFFDCIRHSERPCALPSMAVDSVWHAWLRHAPASLDAYCIKHFGRLIAHVEADRMAVPMEDGLASCLVRARVLQALPVAGMSVPKLFALDRELRMPCGFGYMLAGAMLARQRLDGAGRCAGKVDYLHQSGPAALLAAGLIAQAQYDDYVRRADAGNAAGCSSDGTDAGCDGDGGGGGGGCGGGGD